MKRRDLLKLTAVLPFIGITKIFAKEADIIVTVICAKDEDIVRGFPPRGKFYYLKLKEKTNKILRYAIEIYIPKNELKKYLKELQEFNKNDKNTEYVIVEYKGKYGLMSFDSTEEQIVGEEVLS